MCPMQLLDSPDTDFTETPVYLIKPQVSAYFVFYITRCFETAQANVPGPSLLPLSNAPTAARSDVRG